MRVAPDGLLPVVVLIGRVLKAFGSAFGNESIKAASPHLLEPVGFSKPLNQGRTDGVVGLDESATSNGLGQFVVAETAQRPNLRAIIGTVDGGCYIASTGRRSAV